MMLTFILIVISIPITPHSFITRLKPSFLQILPTVAFLFFSRTTPGISRTVYRYF